MKKISANQVEATVGSGNVFEDLDLPDSDELFLKSGLIFRINQLIDQRGLTDEEAVHQLSITKHALQSMRAGGLDAFSTDELFKHLKALNQDIQITVTDRPASDSGRCGRVTLQSLSA